MFSLSVESLLRFITLKAFVPSREIHSSLTIGSETCDFLRSFSHCSADCPAGLPARFSIMINSFAEPEGSERVTNTSASVGSEHWLQLPTRQLLGYLMLQPALLVNVLHWETSRSLEACGAGRATEIVCNTMQSATLDRQLIPLIIMCNGFAIAIRAWRDRAGIEPATRSPALAAPAAPNVQRHREDGIRPFACRRSCASCRPRPAFDIRPNRFSPR
jgi:hypothetical protein